ncbi:hypothetical protein QC5_2421 [Clostridioides difficile CD34]|nr:hypothetical protein QC5_2421 [Clostridioides difficile CD34]
MTAYIDSISGYYSFIDTQLEDFIIKYGENIVDSNLHSIMMLLCKWGLS